MSRHAKRLMAPRTLQIPRKEHKFIVKPSPGPHNYETSVPLLIAIRDMLGLATNARETKKIIKSGKVLVDAKVRKDHKFPIGLMDILEIPEAEILKIVMINRKGKIVFEDISKDASRTKLYKIRNKTILRGGNLQLNLHDGTNLLIPVKDSRDPEEDIYGTRDTLVVSLANKEIEKHIKYNEGSLAYITGGSHRGEIARIKEIKKIRSTIPNEVVLEGNDGTAFETIEEYVFIIGEESPVLPEVVFP
ncbi:MAG TPA: 30S ribosomal protein S4e [Euryarchaeota archaeon]|nr:30S ribosomal protein S4e [archaeon BMS3Bbin15]HDL15533.1 30S ribosomal protein S4e [Euryarchaeota archaeon]